MTTHKLLVRLALLTCIGRHCRTLVLFGAVLLATASAGAAAKATVIAYSHGTLNFDNTRKVTVGAGGDYATCDTAAASFPKGGPGGIIEFLPGQHTTTCGNIGIRGSILITGQLGQNGERPRITTPLKANGKPMTFITIDPRQHSPAHNFVIENLDIHDTGAAINAWNHRGLVIRNVRVDDSNGADAVKVYPGDQPNTWLEIHDSEVAHGGGGGNIKHNLYLGRLDRVLIDGLYTHSALGAHAFKSIALDLTIRNSTFATSALDYTSALSSLDLSTTLIDIAACSTSLIEDNTLIGMRIFPSDRPGLAGAGAVGVSTASFIDLRRRKSKVGGCDMPGYAESFAFDWEAAAAGGYDRANDALFHHVIRNNEFVNAGQRSLLAVRNVGTAYVEDNGISFTRGRDLPLPDGWFERAVAWLDDNSFAGATILPGAEWTDHPDYPYGAPIFVDGVRVGDAPDPRVPVTVASNGGGTGSGTGDDGNNGEGTSVAGAPSLALFGSGLGALCLAARRRRQRRPAPAATRLGNGRRPA